MDVQGADKARPFVEKAGATFTTVVDDSNLLGQQYGFKAIPNGFLIDETGKVEYKRLGGFDIRRADTKQIVEEWAAQSVAPEGETEYPALGDEHTEANRLFVLGKAMLEAGDRDGALSEWRKAAALEPDNWIVRKQIWALEHPDRFYDGDVDFAWQREQIAREP